MAVERPPIPDLIEVQRNGVRAIESITWRFDDRDWVAPTPCEGWTALDLAGHLVTAIDNWHILLDDSEAGAPSARFTWQTPCDGWTAQDLAGHVVNVSTMWHEVLDDAEAGVATARWRWKVHGSSQR